MKFFLQYLLLHIILVFIFSNCASIGPPGGGPADTHPPYLVETDILPSVRTNISENQRIVLPFNERLLPSTAINALRIEPETEISVRIRNNVIYVKPKQSWPDQFTIFISRNLSDYNNNKLTNPIQLFFSLSDSIAFNTIKGSIFNADSTKISDSSIEPKALADFSLTIPRSFGNVMSWKYNIDFEQY